MEEEVIVTDWHNFSVDVLPIEQRFRQVVLRLLGDVSTLNIPRIVGKYRRIGNDIHIMSKVLSPLTVSHNPLPIPCGFYVDVSKLNGNHHISMYYDSISFSKNIDLCVPCSSVDSGGPKTLEELCDIFRKKII
jgi:hypothetical protein